MKRILFVFVLMLISCNYTTDTVFEKSIKCEDCLVTKEETAVGIAELILFESYGKDQIEDQRPYTVTIENDSIWHIEGTFNKIGFGGVFDIKISAKNGKVLYMIHGK
ncbi:MAG: NTF2 fold immunity protein [Flavobacterium sp.]